VFDGQGPPPAVMDAAEAGTLPLPGGTDNVMSFEELVRLIHRPTRRGRPVLGGQLSLLSA